MFGYWCFWECNAVYFPNAWQEELYSLICQKNQDDPATNLDRIKACLAKDPRLLTARLGEEEITACSLASIYASPEIVFFIIQELEAAEINELVRLVGL